MGEEAEEVLGVGARRHQPGQRSEARRIHAAQQAPEFESERGQGTQGGRVVGLANGQG